MGKDVDVIPEDNFLGTADGILSVAQTIMASILVGHQNSLIKEPNVNGQLNTMDGQYVPTVTPIDIEGVDKT